MQEEGEGATQKSLSFSCLACCLLSPGYAKLVRKAAYPATLTPRNWNSKQEVESSSPQSIGIRPHFISLDAVRCFFWRMKKLYLLYYEGRRIRRMVSWCSASDLLLLATLPRRAEGRDRGVAVGASRCACTPNERARALSPSSRDARSRHGSERSSGEEGDRYRRPRRGERLAGGSENIASGGVGRSCGGAPCSIHKIRFFGGAAVASTLDTALGSAVANCWIGRKRLRLSPEGHLSP